MFYRCCPSLLLIILLTFNIVSGDVSFTMTSDVLYVLEGEKTTFDLNVTSLEEDLFIDVHGDDPRLFEIVGNHTYRVPHRSKNYTLTVTIQGLFVSISQLNFHVRAADFIPRPDLTIDPIVVKVRRQPSTMAEIFKYILIAWLIVSYISMGVKINWPKIWKRLRRPWGVIVGVLCQFLIMPLLAYCLAKLTHLDNVSAIGLIIIGCSPGGWLSNIFTLILDCDLVLSVTMTTCSTVIALGMMPLNLFIYGRGFAAQDETLQAPFGQIILQLLLLCVPVLIGMLIYYKLPKLAEYLKRVLRPVAIIMIILAIAFGVPSSIYIFQAPVEVYLIAIIYPFIGATLGLIFAKVGVLSNRSAVTVSLETGCQNAVVALGLARLSYPYPESDLIAVVPQLITITTVIEGSLVSGIYYIMRRFPGQPYDDEDASSVDSDKDEVIVYKTNEAFVAEERDESQPKPSQTNDGRPKQRELDDSKSKNKTYV